ncbi:MAG: O-methyltransferase [Pyrinomonadaceae bacterium]
MLDSEIQGYAERHTTYEPVYLEKLRNKTLAERGDSNMLSGFYQGRLLSMFSKLVSPNYVLEIGTYMGYSALCLAEGLKPDGKVVTLDIVEETNAFAKDAWRESPYNDQIESHLQNALDFIPGIGSEIDLVFIDADKENYLNYFNLVLPKVRRGGLIIADNVLWSGEVLEAEKGNEVRSSAQALYEYSVEVNKDERVENLFLAVRDGLLVSRVIG